MKNCLVSLCLLFAGVAVAADDTPANPKALEFTKWSGAINVPDPVAISFDTHGRAYVTQTRRRKAQDLDIRSNGDWVPADVGLQSVAEKRELFHRELSVGNDDPRNAARVKDYNGDGVHDYRDLMVISERIHRLEDTDNDGTADVIDLFADGFQTEVTGIAAGVLWHEGTVYATIAPDVWRLRDTDGDGKSDRREVIATGFGLHIAYGGHDMHGLTIGPDGKIYWSIGDKGISVTSKEGRRFHYPNQGGVLRCNPDGSDFEVFAHGLRNVQELAFDEFGNLFGVDNDSDQQGEKERFVYIVPGMDAGWRCNYQYRGADYNPWMQEGLWQTPFEGQAAYILPPIRHFIDGPAGFTYNPGTALSPAYRNYFFLTGAPTGGQHAFQVHPAGASFEMVNEHQIGKGVALVGINFAPDGALYGVDWGGGYPLNQKGAVWKIDAPDSANSPERREVRQLLQEGFRKREQGELVRLLAHVDQRIRLGAQFELANRAAVGALHEAVRAGTPRLARIHAIWGLGQLTRSGVTDATELFTTLLGDDDEIRVQSLRAIRDLKSYDGDSLAALLGHSNPRVRFEAALTLGTHPVDGARGAVVAMIAENDGRDLYLRHAGVTALAGCEGIAELADHESREVRLSAVVALRRRGSEDVARLLEDESDEIVAEAARAIHDDWSIDAALPRLARVLDQRRTTNPVIVLRAINANLRLGGATNAARTLRYASDPGVPQTLRVEALTTLGFWNEPPVLDRVDGRNRRATTKREKLPADAVAEELAELLADEDARIQAGALATAGRLSITIDDAALVALAKSPSATPPLRIEALNLLDRQESLGVTEAVQATLKAAPAKLRIRALQLLADRDKEAAGARIVEVLKTSRDLSERQQSMVLLGRLGTAAADRRLSGELAKLDRGAMDARLELEVLEAARQRALGNDGIRTQLSRLKAQRRERAGNDVLAEFRECRSGGNRQRGRAIFTTYLSAQCIRCHRVGKQGSEVGPDLSGVATRRDQAYLLRSIVAPSADIDEKYRTHAIILESGRVAQGVLVRKNKKVTVLADSTGKEIKIPNDEIDEAAVQKTSIMPEMTKVLTKWEIRDLVAYLASLRDGKKK